MDAPEAWLRRWIPDGARPASRAVVASSLADLRGPTRGIVEFRRRAVNLDNPALLAWMYETVLREAVSVTELQTWLHGPTLVRLWPRLSVSRGVRRAWEERHPILRTRRAAA